MAKNNPQYERMMALMNFGYVNESASHKTNVGKSSFEYQMMGGDGKSYAIVREGKYYYIKSADGDKKNLAEAYDYLGGYMNRKNYEYSSYNSAYNNFCMKMKLVNEACGNAAVSETEKKYDIMTEATDDMKNLIARQRQIMTNASMIMESGYGYKEGTKESPEKPTSNGGNPDGPFTEKAEAKLDTDPKFNAGEPDNQSEPFGDGKAPEKGKDVKDSDIPSDGKAVGAQNPSGGKVTRVDECGQAEHGVISPAMDKWGIKDNGSGPITVDSADMEQIHIDEELDTDFDDGVKGTGVGEADNDHNNGPFTDNVKSELDECGDMMAAGQDMMNEEEGDEDFAEEEGEDFGGEDFEDEGEEEVPADGEDEEFGEEPEFGEGDENFEDEGDEDFGEEGEGDEIAELRAELEALKAELAELKGEDMESDEEMPEEELGDEDMPEGEEMPEGEFGDDEGFPEEAAQDEEPMLGEEDEEALMEAKQQFMNGIINTVVNKMLSEEKTVLHDFGKHPGFRKKVMSLPTTGQDKNEHGEDWNDDSVHNEQPFASKIGSSAPFDKTVAKMITDSIMEALKKK